MQESTMRLTKAVLTDALPPPPLLNQEELLIHRMYSEFKNYTTEVVQTAFDELFTFFENRKLYVLYEDLLNCNPLSDHLHPKSVLPVFYEALMRLQNTLTGRLSLSAMVGFEATVRELFEDESEEAAGLMLEEENIGAESLARLDLATTLQNMLESESNGIIYLKRQHLIENLQISEQIKQLTRSASVYAPDFPEHISVTKIEAKTEDQIEQLNDRIVDLQSRNLHLMQENQRYCTQRDQLDFELKQNALLVNELNSRIEQLESEVDQKDAIILLKQNVINKCEDQNHNFEIEKTATIYEISLLNAKLQEENAILKRANIETSEYKKHCDSLEQHLVSSTKDASQGNDVSAKASEPSSARSKIDEELAILQTSGRNKENSEIPSVTAHDMLLMELIKEQAARDPKYFGLSDDLILQRMRQNGEYNQILEKIQENLFTSQKKVEVAIIDVAKHENSELRNQSDNDVLTWLRKNGKYQHYFKEAKEHLFCTNHETMALGRNESASLSKTSILDSARLAIYTELCKRGFDCKAKEGNEDGGGRNQVSLGKTNVSELDKHCIEFDANGIEGKGPSYAQLEGDIDRAVDAVAHLTNIQSAACNILRLAGATDAATETSNGQLQNSTFQKPKTDVARPSSGVNLESSFNIHYAYQDECTIETTDELHSDIPHEEYAEQWGNAGSEYLKEEDLIAIEHLQQTELLNLIRKRACTRDVFERLFKDAELYNARLSQIEQRYFDATTSTVEERNSEVGAGISLYVSFFTKQMDMIRFAVEFEEEPSGDIAVLTTVPKNQQRKHESGKFGIAPGGSSFVEVHSVDALQISRPISAFEARRRGVGLFKSNVEYNRQNSLLLSCYTK